MLCSILLPTLPESETVQSVLCFIIDYYYYYYYYIIDGTQVTSLYGSWLKVAFNLSSARVRGFAKFY